MKPLIFIAAIFIGMGAIAYSVVKRIVPKKATTTVVVDNTKFEYLVSYLGVKEGTIVANGTFFLGRVKPIENLHQLHEVRQYIKQEMKSEYEISITSINRLPL